MTPVIPRASQSSIVLIAMPQYARHAGTRCFRTVRASLVVIECPMSGQITILLRDLVQFFIHQTHWIRYRACTKRTSYRRGLVSIATFFGSVLDRGCLYIDVAIAYNRVPGVITKTKNEYALRAHSTFTDLMAQSQQSGQTTKFPHLVSFIGQTSINNFLFFPDYLTFIRRW